MLLRVDETCGLFAVFLSGLSLPMGRLIVQRLILRTHISVAFHLVDIDVLNGYVVVDVVGCVEGALVLQVGVLVVGVRFGLHVVDVVV
jgi:hypothetical protein